MSQSASRVGKPDSQMLSCWFHQRSGLYSKVNLDGRFLRDILHLDVGLSNDSSMDVYMRQFEVEYWSKALLAASFRDIAGIRRKIDYFQSQMSIERQTTEREAKQKREKESQEKERAAIKRKI